MKNFFYNPCNKTFKSPIGANVCDEKIIITIKINSCIKFHNLNLNIFDDNNELKFAFPLIDINNDQYQACFQISEAGLYWYCFSFDDVYGHHYIGSSNNLDATLTDNNPVWWQLLIHKPFIGKLDWVKGKVIYQIFVDRFYHGGNNPVRDDVIMHSSWKGNPNYKKTGDKVLNNDFFGGDLQGIIKKLDYLADLNVGIIYLNPIFEAYSNHKYDTANYRKIDSMFGTEDDFVNLCKEAKKRGISIILDGVFNHTGDNSIYFNRYGKYPEIGAYQSKSSAYYSWYRFIDFPHKYHSWWGFLELPAVNQHSKDYLSFITGKEGVLQKWLTLGAKGFRLDVIDELDDNFIQLIHDSVKSHNEDNYILGEVWEDASNKYAYGVRKSYLNGRQVDAVMNYPLKDAILDFVIHGDCNHLINTMRQIINNYPKHTIDCLMNHLGTHDTIRLINNFVNINVNKMSKDEQANYKMTDDDYQNAIKKLKLAVALQFTLPGVPSIYYGDEVGLDGLMDPFCRRPFPWDNIDYDLLDWYKKISLIRKHSVFIDGEYNEYPMNDKKIFAFTRQNSSEKIVIFVNNSENDLFLLDNGINLCDNVNVEKMIVYKQSFSIYKIEEEEDRK